MSTLDAGRACNHTGRILDANQRIIRCGCGDVSLDVGHVIEKVLAEQHKDMHVLYLVTKRAMVLEAVQAELEALQPVIDLWQFIKDNGTCFSGSDNRLCQLNESDDPKEYCLYHKAWAIEARTAQGEGKP